MYQEKTSLQQMFHTQENIPMPMFIIQYNILLLRCLGFKASIYLHLKTLTYVKRRKREQILGQPGQERMLGKNPGIPIG
jgi:hypothetical protein